MKTAYELAMEKLKRKDAEQGDIPAPLTARQKRDIAEIRNLYKARQAEREILHKAEMAKARLTGEPEAVRSVEEGYQHDMKRFADEEEAKVRSVRSLSAR